jgi:hypothetical protein
MNKSKELTAPNLAEFTNLNQQLKNSSLLISKFIDENNRVRGRRGSNVDRLTQMGAKEQDASESESFLSKVNISNLNNLNQKSFTKKKDIIETNKEFAIKKVKLLTKEFSPIKLTKKNEESICENFMPKIKVTKSSHFQKVKN